GFSVDAVSALKNYNWPGNVRELKNVVTRAALLADSQIESSHLGLAAVDVSVSPEFSGNNLSFKEKVRNTKSDEEKKMILEALKKAKGNKLRTAKSLGINRMTLY